METPTFTPEMVREILTDVPVGSTVYLEYISAGKPTKQAIDAAKPAIDAGMPRHTYVGTLRSQFVTASKEYVFAMNVMNRGGAPRCFNPARGTVQVLRVVKLAAVEEARAA